MRIRGLMIPAGNVWAGGGNRPSANGTLGSRGSRSDSAAARRVAERPKPSPPPVVVPPAPPPDRFRAWLGTWLATLVGVAAGGLMAGALFGSFGHAPGDRAASPLDLLLGAGGIVVLLQVLRHRHAARAQPPRAAVSIATTVDPSPDQTPDADPPSGGSSFDQGLQGIRRTDPGFDPTRFAGYAGMVFRDAQGAWMTRDIGSLRGRVTPEMYGELQAQCDRLRDAAHANHVEQIEITAEITEAWQESGRDYVTASIDGSIVDYTVDEASDALVDGSRTISRNVEEFWTFTRPAGLNFWMLSAIQAS
jgi:predicted lipid-binding transport protein (Tim44 family)